MSLSEEASLCARAQSLKFPCPCDFFPHKTQRFSPVVRASPLLAPPWQMRETRALGGAALPSPSSVSRTHRCPRSQF